MPTLSAFDATAALAGGALKMNVPVRALTGTLEDEWGALIHGYSGTIWTLAVLRSRDSEGATEAVFIASEALTDIEKAGDTASTSRA